MFCDHSEDHAENPPHKEWHEIVATTQFPYKDDKSLIIGWLVGCCLYREVFFFMQINWPE